jgi:phosphatidylglycerophosphate synthase
MCIDPAFENIGDLKRSTGCAVHVPTFEALWGLSLAIFVLNVILGIAAAMYMKRKRHVVERNELAAAWLQILVCALGLTLAALQLSSRPSADGMGTIHSRRLGVDVFTSVVFSMYNLFGYMAGLIKPIAQSEISIAHFVLERSNRRFVKGYKKMLVVFCALLAVSSRPK